MRLSFRLYLFAVTFALAIPSVADAGMPSITLTDLARMRLQTISFFLVGFLISAWLIKLLWNRLHMDFPTLPRLGYKQAVAVVTLWGLLFILVLTMISGARELMTPGAWEKQGATYKLAKEAPPPESGPVDRDRKRHEKLEALRSALLGHARTHHGRYPADASSAEIADNVWLLPEPSSMRYIYVNTFTSVPGSRILAYEPEIEGPERLVLFTDGAIRKLHIDEIARQLPVEGR